MPDRAKRGSPLESDRTIGSGGRPPQNGPGPFGEKVLGWRSHKAGIALIYYDRYCRDVANKSKPLSFESSLEELEKIINDLERAEKPLEEQLKAFEKGITLSRDCLQRLDEVERKVQVLVQDDSGQLKPQEFEE